MVWNYVSCSGRVHSARHLVAVYTLGNLAEPLNFQFDGRDVPFEEGDTIGSALWKADVKTISRSMKYHRPRGLYCATGSCANCLVNVDGTPNVPACMEQAKAGIVESQNRIGSAKMDVLSVVDKVYRKGFDPHGAFTKFSLINKAFLRSVRFMSGWGKAPAPGSAGWTGKRYQHEVDEIIIGAGTHGLNRARDATGEVIVIEELPTVGGDALWTKETIPSFKGEIWNNSVAFGIYGDLIAVRQGKDLHEFKAKRVTVATGQHDGMPIFPGNDAPGILSLRGAKRLVREHGADLGKVAWHGPDEGFQGSINIVVKGLVEAADGAPITRAKIAGKWHEVDTIVCNVPGMKRIELLQQAGCALTFKGGLTPIVDETGKTSRDDIYALFTESP